MNRATNLAATFREDALRIRVSAPRRWWTTLFAALWTCGWCLTVAVLALDLLRHPDMGLERNALWLAVWLAAGPVVGFVILWRATGQQEVVQVQGADVRIERYAGPFRHTQHIDGFSIASIGYRQRRPPHPLDIAPVARFWRAALGRVVIGTPRRLYAFGEGLTDAEAEEAVALIQGRLAHTHLATPFRPPAPVTSAMRYSAAAGTAILGAMVIWPAITVPVRLAILDRAICFGDDSLPPEEPADIRRLPRNGRLRLVALDGIPTERLDAIAEQFRSRYRIPVLVTEARANVDAYDPQRRQANAATVVSALDRMYPGRAVVIGVTDHDMYIPKYRWRYAFSYRAEGRIAVVSTARMERGCLGLLQASGERQDARLRKMIGKNVGVLYFKLPLSNDPRSLMYAYVGGPQELDVMSEIF